MNKTGTIVLLLLLSLFICSNGFSSTSDVPDEFNFFGDGHFPILKILGKWQYLNNHEIIEFAYYPNAPESGQSYCTISVFGSKKPDELIGFGWIIFEPKVQSLEIPVVKVIMKKKKEKLVSYTYVITPFLNQEYELKLLVSITKNGEDRSVTAIYERTE